MCIVLQCICPPRVMLLNNAESVSSKQDWRETSAVLAMTLEEAKKKITFYVAKKMFLCL